MNIVFRDPPITKPRRYGGKNIQFFLQLSENPNKWAVLREDCPKATATEKFSWAVPPSENLSSGSAVRLPTMVIWMPFAMAAFFL